MLICSADIEDTLYISHLPTSPEGMPYCLKTLLHDSFSIWNSPWSQDLTKARPLEVTQYLCPQSRNKSAKEIITCVSAELPLSRVQGERASVEPNVDNERLV